MNLCATAATAAAKAAAAAAADVTLRWFVVGVVRYAPTGWRQGPSGGANLFRLSVCERECKSRCGCRKGGREDDEGRARSVGGVASARPS